MSEIPCFPPLESRCQPLGVGSSRWEQMAMTYQHPVVLRSWDKSSFKGGSGQSGHRAFRDSWTWQRGSAHQSSPSSLLCVGMRTCSKYSSPLLPARPGAHSRWRGGPSSGSGAWASRVLMFLRSPLQSVNCDNSVARARKQKGSARWQEGLLLN